MSVAAPRVGSSNTYITVVIGGVPTWSDTTCRREGGVAICSDVTWRHRERGSGSETT
jgi:hypothetical protein